MVHRGQVIYDLFHWALAASVAPSDSGNLCVPVGTFPVGVEGGQVAWQRNVAVRNALTEKRCEWVCFIDTDQAPDTPDWLDRLLDYGLPLISAVICQRGFPFHVAAFKTMDPPTPIPLSEIPMDGTVPVKAVGTGCLLIRREVLDAVGDPWFQCGQFNPELLQEDIFFSLAAVEKGYRPYLAGNVRMGHEIRGKVWPGAEVPWFQLPGPEDIRMPIPTGEIIDDYVERLPTPQMGKRRW